MEILLSVEGGVVLILAGALIRIAFNAGVLRQEVNDLTKEHVRLRDRLDKFLDPPAAAIHHRGQDGC